MFPMWTFDVSFVKFSNSFSSCQSLLDNLERIPDTRVRLSKLIGKSVLGEISMWIAFPPNEKFVPGAKWYDQVWDKNRFGGYEYVDQIISVSPCQNSNKIFLQIGAHLGIFPLIATYRGCRGIAVEPIPAASQFTQISAKINNWGEDKFVAINAIGSRNDEGFMWFDPKGIVVSNDDGENITGKVRIPKTTLDALNNKYGFNGKENKSEISFVIIDVEGYEHEVLLGGQKLIEEQSVLIYQIEVWTNSKRTGIVKSFPGLELLINNGYRLYTTASNSKMNFKSCDEITNRLTDITKIFNGTCRGQSQHNVNCLSEVFAIRKDLPPLRQWLSECPK